MSTQARGLVNSTLLNLSRPLDACLEALLLTSSPGMHAVMQALKDRAAERSFVLAARKGAETAEIKRLEGTELQQLSAGEQQRLQEQLADAKFRCLLLSGRRSTA
jgi:hypothetical protein